MIEAEKSNPIPDSGTCPFASNMLLATVKLPICCPALVGLKSTLVVQLAPAASVAVQVVLASSNPPETLSAKPVNATVPELFTVAVCALLTVPTPVVAKLKAPGCICTEPAAPPVPLSGKIAGVVNTADPTVKVPVTVPFTVGVNTIPTAQLEPAARLVPQAFCVTLNGPETKIVSPLAAPLLEFVTVAVCAADACPRVASENDICAGLTDNPEVPIPTPLMGT